MNESGLLIHGRSDPGMTLIELVIVLAIMGILLVLAVPAYSGYMMRVYRTEAIGMLLRASMCQQKLYASEGYYDTSQCDPAFDDRHYRISYTPAGTRSDSWIVMARPVGTQSTDTCGILSLDQNGQQSISGNNISTVMCWSGR